MTGRLCTGENPGAMQNDSVPYLKKMYNMGDTALSLVNGVTEHFGYGVGRVERDTLITFSALIMISGDT